MAVCVLVPTNWICRASNKLGNSINVPAASAQHTSSHLTRFLWPWTWPLSIENRTLDYRPEGHVLPVCLLEFCPSFVDHSANWIALFVASSTGSVKNYAYARLVRIKPLRLMKLTRLTGQLWRWWHRHCFPLQLNYIENFVRLVSRTRFPR